MYIYPYLFCRKGPLPLSENSIAVNNNNNNKIFQQFIAGIMWDLKRIS